MKCGLLAISIIITPAIARVPLSGEFSSEDLTAQKLLPDEDQENARISRSAQAEFYDLLWERTVDVPVLYTRGNLMAKVDTESSEPQYSTEAHAAFPQQKGLKGFLQNINRLRRGNSQSSDLSPQQSTADPSSSPHSSTIGPFSSSKLDTLQLLHRYNQRRRKHATKKLAPQQKKANLKATGQARQRPKIWEWVRRKMNEKRSKRDLDDYILSARHSKVNTYPSKRVLGV